MLMDLAEARDLLDRGTSQPSDVTRRDELDDGHEPVAGQGVRGHLAVPGLEDMKRKHIVGKEDDAGQWEESADAGEVPKVMIVVHRVAREKEEPV
jgi:hypothetical protein